MWEYIQFANSDLVDHPRQRPDFKQPLISFVFVPTALTLMAPKSRKTKTRSDATPSCAETPDLESESIAAQCEGLLDRNYCFQNRDVMTREMLRCWQSLPSTTRKSMLSEVRLHLASRFHFGLQEDRTLVVDLLAKYGSNAKGKRNCLAVLQRWSAMCRKLQLDIVSVSKARKDDISRIHHHEDAWVLLGDAAHNLPGCFLKRVERYCSDMHDPFLISWQRISFMMMTAEYVFDAFMAVPSFSIVPNPIADSRYFRNLSDFFDYIIGWELIPCSIDSSFSVKSVKMVYGDRFQLDTFHTSIYRSTKFVMFILDDTLQAAMLTLSKDSHVEYTVWTTMDKLFLFFANPATENDIATLSSRLAEYYGQEASATQITADVEWLTSALPHQPPDVDKGCRRSFLKRPRALLIPSSDSPACRCSADKPSKRCLHYCWWFWGTVLSNLLPVLSDLEKTQRVVFDMLELVLTTWRSEHLNVVEIVNCVTRLSRFTCNRFLLSSVRAIQKLASFCISTRIHLNVDKTVEELMCRSVLGLSSFPFPVLSCKLEDLSKKATLVRYLLRSPVQKYFEEEFSAIKNLQKLAQYERAVVGDYLKRKDWI